MEDSLLTLSFNPWQLKHSYVYTNRYKCKILINESNVYRTSNLIIVRIKEFKILKCVKINI